MKEILEKAKLLLENNTLSDDEKEKALKELLKNTSQSESNNHEFINKTTHFDKSINPFRMIRIVKDLKTIDVAKMFGCTSPYINSIENGKRDPQNIEFLKNGFDKMGVSLDSYFTLREFAIIVNNADLNEKQKYQIMLTKTLGEIYPELHQKAEEILSVNFGNLLEKSSNIEKK